jgi:hypothetical protein
MLDLNSEISEERPTRSLSINIKDKKDERISCDKWRAMAISIASL